MSQWVPRPTARQGSRSSLPAPGKTFPTGSGMPAFEYRQAGRGKHSQDCRSSWGTPPIRVEPTRAQPRLGRSGGRHIRQSAAVFIFPDEKPMQGRCEALLGKGGAKSQRNDDEQEGDSARRRAGGHHAQLWSHGQRQSQSDRRRSARRDLVAMALLAIGLGYRQALVVAIVVPCVFGLTLIVNYYRGHLPKGRN